MLESLSPIDVALIKKIGGNGSSYTLPIASETTLGGVKPVAKTDAMTQSVGVDEAGGLWAKEASGGGGGNQWTHIVDFMVEEDVNELFVINDSDGNTFEYDELFAQMIFTGSTNNTSESSVELRFLFDKSTSLRSDIFQLDYAQRKTGTILHSVYAVMLPYSDSKNWLIRYKFTNIASGNMLTTWKKLSGIRLWCSQYIASGTVIKLYGRNRI